MEDFIPKWHKELEIFTKIKPLIILEGNVLDSYQYPVDGSNFKGSIIRLSEYLHGYLCDMGYNDVVFYDSLRGFYNPCDQKMIEEFAKITKVDASELSGMNFSGRGRIAPDVIRTATTQSEKAIAVVLDFASRYIVSPSSLGQNEVDSFTILTQASLLAKNVSLTKITNESDKIDSSSSLADNVSTSKGPLKNIIILITNKVNDLPSWFYLQNPNVKTISIGYPTKEEREELVKGVNFKSFFTKEIFEEDYPYYENHQEELIKIQDKFVGLTEGFSFTELNGLRTLCKNEQTHIKDICGLIDLYKYGIKENPWHSLDLGKIRNGKENFEKRVKGQDAAISKTLDIIKRAITGMSGLQGSSVGRPKGVLFFAGPTGTGKTETAKTIAELIFGDESRCIRFDMSEYGQSHSDQKLLGAPPGYVGYEAGGQLTNAIKKNPFSILLFDEIEKAHPSILDKFLQILEDGRMTDGQGNTVYFSECIIIFTSNLGIYTLNSQGVREANVNSKMEYDEVSSKVKNAISDYFKFNIGRPEILNRIGENIVVFDYIRPEVAKSILLSQIEKVNKNLMIEKNIEIKSDAIIDKLEALALNNLDNGGRGIGNVVENYYINPLSRYLFDNDIFDNAHITIKDLITDKMPAEIECE